MTNSDIRICPGLLGFGSPFRETARAIVALIRRLEQVQAPAPAAELLLLWRQLPRLEFCCGYQKGPAGRLQDFFPTYRGPFRWQSRGVCLPYRWFSTSLLLFL